MNATISLRVSVHLWSAPERRADLLALLQRHRKTVSEVALFTHANHPAMPLALARERAAALGRALPAFRDLGLSAGINVTATIGHMDEYLAGSLSEPWQHLVGHDGRVSASCYCWTDPRVLGYVRELYRAMAGAGPDFIWVDDDLRLVGYRPTVDFACFCEGCLARFSEETSRPWTRPGLLAGFDDGSREDRLALRRQWLEHNRRYIAALLAAVRSAVDEVTPGLPLGFMTIDQTWAGNGYAAWADALRAGGAAGNGRGGAGPEAAQGSATGSAPKWRPGGGFYSDETPGGVLVKAHATGRQVSFLPPDVEDIQYEHENGLYQPLAKSRRIFAAEMPAAVGCGCTGIALNVMGYSEDPIGEFLPYFDAAAAVKPLLDAAVDSLGVLPRAGLWRAGTEDAVAAVNPDSSWIGQAMFGYDVGPLGPLAEIGLPAAYRRAGAAVALLAGDEVVQFSRVEIEELLAGGVLLDGPGLGRLEELGLADLAGFRLAGRREKDAIEVYTHDPLNGSFSGWHRDCRPSFFYETTYLLEPASPDARVLSVVEDFSRQRHGAGSGCFENRLGGRVAVLGYYPWRGLLSLAKTSQLKSLCRWLSRDRLPAYVASYHKAALWCVERPGSVAALLLNCSLDEAEGMEMHLRDAGSADLVRSDGSRARVRAVRRDGPYGVFTLERIGSWEAALLVGR